MDNMNNLKEDVEKVIRYSQGLETRQVNCSTLMELWWENKEWLYHKFGDKLIWETGETIAIDVDTKAQEEMFRVFVNEVDKYLRGYNLHVSRDEIVTWYDWIYDNKEGFFSNTVISPLPDTDMKHGMKLIRAFKFFNFPQTAIRHIQDLASQVIQQTKIEGILCISIHPLDYLTISENNSNWRSCHALDGEYRAGNLSYMIDPSTIVCYLKSKQDTQLNNFPQGMLWNNKKWRVLLHVQRDLNIMYVNRQYPFDSDELIHAMQKTRLMRDLGFWDCYRYFKDAGFKKVGDEELSQNYLRLFSYIFDPAELCGGDSQSLQYNDFVYSPYYTPQYILASDGYWSFHNSKEAIIRNCKVEIGKKVPCLNGCGEYLTDSCCMVCDTCLEQDVEHCCDCSAPIYDGDFFGLDEFGEIYCINCAERQGMQII